MAAAVFAMLVWQCYLEIRWKLYLFMRAVGYWIKAHRFVLVLSNLMIDCWHLLSAWANLCIAVTFLEISSWQLCLVSLLAQHDWLIIFDYLGIKLCRQWDRNPGVWSLAFWVVFLGTCLLHGRMYGEFLKKQPRLCQDAPRRGPVIISLALNSCTNVFDKVFGS